MKIALVYQAGIANVFEVTNFGYEIAQRGDTRRLLQSDFHSCEYFARGMKAAGANVRSYGCNKAGDITNNEWSDNRGPFREATRWPT